MKFHLRANLTHFHIIGYAPELALIERPRATRKWAIVVQSLWPITSALNN